MNKIQRLLQEHCPNGVEWTYIGDSRFIEIADNNRKPVKSSNRTMGNNPYYGANNIQDYVDGYTHDGTYILVAEDGSASIKNYSIQWATGKFWANNHVHILRGIDGIDSRFMFHYLHTVNFTPFLTGGERAKLTKGKLLEIPIPLPPRPVQQEIVRILDKFTTLEAELEAELEARKKQYEYYRDRLLKFDNKAEVGWKTLGEITIKIYSGGTPKTECPEYWENGTIPWMSSGEVNLGIIYQTEKFITEKGLLNSSAKFVPENSLVIALAGQGKTRGKVARTRIKLTTNQSLAALTFDNNKVNVDYVYHYMVTQYEKLRQISSGNGTRGGLNLSMISTFSIPIPYPNDTEKSLEEQARIVAILDKFDTLVNSISEGLPKEIALRRKQYEYYREQLLSFPKR